MVKGGMLKDDAKWSDLAPKEGQVFMMMGSAEELPQEPVQKTVFMEDLSDEQASSLAEFGRPAGLTNLGNTCYMNATLQCLRAVPELQQSLKKFSNRMKEGDMSNNLTATMRDLFGLLDASNQSIPPLVFLGALRTAFPQFAQKGNGGEFMQQDAEECWTQVMISLSQQLPKLGGGAEEKASLSNSAITQLFSGEMLTTMTNTENSEEPKTSRTEKFDKLSCHIGNTTSFAIEGIKASLEEPITKQSETLGREAVYQKSSRITSLPYYLTLQFVRFFWKQDVKVKAKIVKPVEFPFVLDIYEFCTEELKTKLQPARKLYHENEDKKLQQQATKKQKGEDKMEVEKKEEGKSEIVPMEVVNTDPARMVNETGLYELFAVLTHKGRNADGGHYVAWIKETKGDGWLKFDDDTVSPAIQEDIKKLSGKGGGDWHMAYMCLYRSIPPQ
eukprot:TRINITY_DN530_c0_g1_i1.p1 TRINITY_DN530_c0_g1~~TRINITY_DN530_c0_g1_i1.p1  ORF type:complete len:444 (+),score=161.00 TRINITY_DN530_c0_g1_i1:255-1586(+)